uniref:Uncharacterized protein n=2 Tax=Phaeomonas parva TaxID=124430 RepID=A0A7S1U230_9STRA|mmetsp:Transcript_27957/g.89084  ORF Transcript_27957/g.89084 Transcript_27957/m.89084 type:complete len:118 (+) Transcript_27957:171-524(+)|eukprot:CAMPEP_0118856974 /NCGR_PEP_ID=MMETSP1163-20130328/4265_1 /TAXON_ID=124430 /ORGANISM="Phaeomonas parva, Strain CCMP2877" /LENGTH=117 /DNA_ID=CAMNT_0006790213 /DNA_START=119 /DNA_END=472 /DNA_ORIENTATION=-
MSEGFDPNKSRVSEDRLAEFIVQEVDPDLSSVPGVGDKAKEMLLADGVETTYQLIGKFLQLKGASTSVREHADAMWYYLKGVGINSYRAGIVLAIAEKVNTMMSGLYDPEEFETAEA